MSLSKLFITVKLVISFRTWSFTNVKIISEVNIQYEILSKCLIINVFIALNIQYQTIIYHRCLKKTWATYSSSKEKIHDREIKFSMKTSNCSLSMWFKRTLINFPEWIRSQFAFATDSEYKLGIIKI